MNKDITIVCLSNNAKKDILKIPHFIARKLQLWMLTVSQRGIQETRMIKGFHDEALNGNRCGQRSVRLNISYRAIYEIKNNEVNIKYIEVQEVNKHDYK